MTSLEQVFNQIYNLYACIFYCFQDDQLLTTLSAINDAFFIMCKINWIRINII
jgi:hypothetical protein